MGPIDSGSDIFWIKYYYFIYDILLWVQYILDQIYFFHMRYLIMGPIYSGSDIIILYMISYYGSNIFWIRYNYFI